MVRMVYCLHERWKMMPIDLEVMNLQIAREKLHKSAKLLNPYFVFGTPGKLPFLGHVFGKRRRARADNWECRYVLYKGIMYVRSLRPIK